MKLLNYGKWKELNEQAPAASTKPTEWSDLKIEGGGLVPGKAVRVQGNVAFGPMAGALTAQPEELTKGGVAILKDPVVYLNTEKSTGLAIGPNYYTKGQNDTLHPNEGKIAILSFSVGSSYAKNTTTAFGTTKITSVMPIANTLTAYSFVGVMLKQLGLTADNKELLPYYSNIIKAVGQLAPGLPNLAQSIQQYNADLNDKTKKEQWKNTLIGALAQIFPSTPKKAGDITAQKFVNDNLQSFEKLFS